MIPPALNKMKGNILQRLINPEYHNFLFLATAIKESESRVNKKFMKYFNNHPNCELSFKTADNTRGGFFDRGDVYIYPSTKEGVGLTITEAMCTGMPIVTSDYPTMNEWLDDNIEGRLIKIAQVKRGSMPMDKVIIDTNHLAEIMLDYIKFPNKVTEQSINARSKVEKDYNWDDRDEMILKLFNINI